MDARLCARDGCAVVIGSHGLQRYCSKRCGRVARGRQAAPLPVSVCSLSWCAAEFQPRDAHHRYCCTDHHELAKREESAGRRASRCCEVCGSPTDAGTGHSRKYCSDRCKRSTWKAREAAGQYGMCTKSGCDKPNRARGLCSTHYNRAYFPDSQKRWPGDPEQRRRNLRKKTQRRRAVTKGVTAEVVDRDKVGDRDGWRCGICRRKVDRNLAWPHPRSPSLDHIVPISEHGPHTYANTRISHLKCNTDRSNRGGHEQLALIG